MMSVNKWKSRTFAAGHSRSALLKDVDDKLEAYSNNPSAGKLIALCGAIERWSASKQSTQPGRSGGYAALLNGNRNKSGAVQELVTEVRRCAVKPAHWPDADAGTTYVVDLDTRPGPGGRGSRAARCSREIRITLTLLGVP